MSAEPELRAELRAQMHEMGIEVVLGDGLRTLPRTPPRTLAS